MGGSSGTTAGYQKQGVNQGLANTNAWQASQSNPAIAQLMASYGSGGMSYQDMLGKAGAMGGVDTSGLDKQIADLQAKNHSVQFGGQDIGFVGTQDEKDQNADQIASLQAQKAAMGTMGPSAAMDALALGTGTGYQLASDQVANNPLYAGLFGKGGLGEQSQNQYGIASRDLDTDRQSLMGRDESYGLTPQDLAAYGQASDSIGRQFGAQGNNLAQALADRGLSSGVNGVAAQSFSGLMGNQNEQLKNAQMQIAQNRIQTAMGLAQSRTNMDLQRQGQAGQLSLGVGQLGNAAQQAAYGQNLSGIQTRAGLSGTAAQLTMAQQAQQQEIANERFAQLQATKTPSLGEALEAGFIGGAGSSAGQIAASPGTGATSFSKSFGSTLGSAGMGGMAGGAGSAFGGAMMGGQNLMQLQMLQKLFAGKTPSA